MNPGLQRSFDVLLKRSFGEMLELLDIHKELEVERLTMDAVDKHRLFSVMFTISSSIFRVLALVHFPMKRNSMDDIYEYLKLENGSDIKKAYQDYVLELGNNFCGSVCRILGNEGLSTGMSTPALLANRGGSVHLRASEQTIESHIGSNFHGQRLFSASLWLFANDGEGTNIELNIQDISVENDSSGELEFF